MPLLGLEELVERYAAGEVVDDADEAREHALGDELQEVGVGQPGVVGLADHVVGDLATAGCDVACECVDGAMDGVVRLLAGPHELELGRVETEGVEHGGVERDAIRVVDSDADCHAGDLAVDGSECRVGHGAT